jgi:DNA-binding CsgD family transcriptional regulator
MFGKSNSSILIGMNSAANGQVLNRSSSFGLGPEIGSGIGVGYLVPKGSVMLVLTDVDGTTAVWHRSTTHGTPVDGPAPEPLLRNSLSRAEHAVVRLVAEGQTNREIAHRLHVSHRTVDSHVSHALSKLGMTSRVQLARYVVENSL